MSVVSLEPADLGRLLTFITGFMCDGSTSYKTYHELLAIYHSCKDTVTPQADKSNDLRITDFITDMKNSAWRDEIVVVLGVWEGRVLVRDGIHRGIAYLACLTDGISVQDLPALFLGY
jgi:hypothetical protein